MKLSKRPFAVQVRANYEANKKKKNHITSKYCKALSQQKFDPNDPVLLRAKAKIEAVQNWVRTGALSPVPLTKIERREQTLSFNPKGFWEWI